MKAEARRPAKQSLQASLFGAALLVSLFTGAGVATAAPDDSSDSGSGGTSSSSESSNPRGSDEGRSLSSDRPTSRERTRDANAERPGRQSSAGPSDPSGGPSTPGNSGDKPDESPSDDGESTDPDDTDDASDEPSAPSRDTDEDDSASAGEAPSTPATTTPEPSAEAHPASPEVSTPAADTEPATELAHTQTTKTPRAVVPVDVEPDEPVTEAPPPASEQTNIATQIMSMLSDVWTSLLSDHPAAPSAPLLAGAMELARRDLELWLAAEPIYGNPDVNQRYWVGQSSMNCMLMATAMIIGQLTGRTPTEAEIVNETMNKFSFVSPGRPMYEGLRKQDAFATPDSLKVLSHHGIAATLTQFGAGQDAQALDALKAALSDPKKAVMVGVASDFIWYADTLPSGQDADHEVVVIGYDPNTGMVHLNDSGNSRNQLGKNYKVPVAAFMAGWQASGFEMIVAQKREQPGLRDSTWTSLRPSVEEKRSPRNEHDLHFRATRGR